MHNLVELWSLMSVKAASKHTQLLQHRQKLVYMREEWMKWNELSVEEWHCILRTDLKSTVIVYLFAFNKFL